MERNENLYAEFVITDNFPKVWKIWESYGTTMFGIFPNFYLYNDSGEFTMILGNRIINKEEVYLLKIPEKMYHYALKVCEINKVNCIIKTEKFNLEKENSIYPEYIISNNFEEVKGYIPIGFIFSSSQPYIIATNKVEEKALEKAKDAIESLNNESYLTLLRSFEIYLYSIR